MTSSSRFAPYAPLFTTALMLGAVIALQWDRGSSLNAEPQVTGTATFSINNPIDQFVLARLQAEKIDPSGLCTDDEFIRRVSLDLNGSIPSIPEVKVFLADKSPKKREKLVERLLKNDRYGDHWQAMWGDLLREHSNSRRQEGTVRGSYREWMQDALNRNMPYDLFAKSLIDALGTAEDDAAVNFYLRDENNRVETVNNISTVFMGTRMACAQCHDHPFDKWTQTDFHGLMAFFTRVNVAVDPYMTLVKIEGNRGIPEAAKPILEPYFKEAREKVALHKANFRKGVDVAEGTGGGGMMMGGVMEMMGDMKKGVSALKALEAKLTPPEMQRMRQMLQQGGVRKVVERAMGEYRMPADGDGQKKGKGGEVVAPVFPWDPSKKTEGKGSRRSVLANYVTQNRQFAAVQANRTWAYLFGKGIVDAVDDFRPKNPPSNPELLDFLTEEFIKSKFDNKALITLIVNSSTYQRSSVPTVSNRSDTVLFSHAKVRRMTAEQMYDSILVATGKTTGLGAGGAYAVGMAGDMMAEKVKKAANGPKAPNIEWAADLPTPARTGTFMNTFNQPNRDETMCKREDSGSVTQALEMLNGSVVTNGIKNSALIKHILDAKSTPIEAANELYLATLTRPATAVELRALANRSEGGATREWMEDVYWALLNTREFTFVK